MPTATGLLENLLHFIVCMCIGMSMVLVYVQDTYIGLHACAAEGVLLL